MFVRLSSLFLLPLSLVVVLSGCKDSVEQSVKTSKTTVYEPAKESGAFKAKVHSAVGSVAYLKGGTDFWSNLHVSQYVFENYRVRTFRESEAILYTIDGTVLILAENSDVEFNSHFRDSLVQEVDLNINEGTIQFDVQKQKNRQYTFRSGTSRASIRGTAGFVGSLDGQLVASLKEGKVDVQDAKGNVTSISQNQTLLVTKSGEAKVMELASSGTASLTAVLDSMVKTGGLDNVEELEKSLKSFDAGYVDQQKEFENKLNFQPTSIPETVSEPSVTLQAQLNPGVIVSVLGEKDTVPASGEYKRTFSWGKETSGLKRFLATCSNGEVEVPCYVWTTEYVEPTVAAVADSTVAPDSVAVVDSVAAVDSLVVDSAKAKEPVKVAAVSEPEPEISVISKNGMILKLAGAPVERVRIPRNQEEGQAGLLITLSGISAEELNDIESIIVYRGDHIVHVINSFPGMVFEVPVTMAHNEVAEYEVLTKMKDGSNIRAYKKFKSN